MVSGISGKKEIQFKKQMQILLQFCEHFINKLMINGQNKKLVLNLAGYSDFHTQNSFSPPGRTAQS